MKTIPEPIFVTGDVTPHITAYAWQCEAYGLSVLGDTRDEARANFQAAMISEGITP